MQTGSEYFAFHKNNFSIFIISYKGNLDNFYVHISLKKSHFHSHGNVEHFMGNVEHFMGNVEHFMGNVERFQVNVER